MYLHQEVDADIFLACFRENTHYTARTVFLMLLWPVVDRGEEESNKGSQERSQGA